jgi:4-hydroxy-2-oxoglutarate aldolase
MDVRGVFPPIATPFTADGADIDTDAVRFNVARWMATRLRGLVVLGTNGEAALVDDDEAERLVAAVREDVPRDRWLIAGTGRESTRATIATTRRLAAAGADAALVRVPGFFKSQMGAEALVRHYTAVADASPVPVLLYNFAAVFGVNMTVDVIARLAEHPNIAGLKESGGDVGQVADEVNGTPDGFAVVVGSAATLFASLCVGADGAVVAVANVVPEACVRLYDLTVSGRHTEARALQRVLTPLARAVTAAHGVAGLKAAMALAGYRGGPPRAPLLPASPAAADDLARHLAALHAFLETSHAVAT